MTHPLHRPTERDLEQDRGPFRGVRNALLLQLPFFGVAYLLYRLCSGCGTATVEYPQPYPLTPDELRAVEAAFLGWELAQLPPIDDDCGAELQAIHADDGDFDALCPVHANGCLAPMLGAIVLPPRPGLDQGPVVIHEALHVAVACSGAAGSPDHYDSEHSLHAVWAAEAGARSAFGRARQLWRDGRTAN